MKDSVSISGNRIFPPQTPSNRAVTNINIEGTDLARHGCSNIPLVVNQNWFSIKLLLFIALLCNTDQSSFTLGKLQC